MNITKTFLIGASVSIFIVDGPGMALFALAWVGISMANSM